MKWVLFVLLLGGMFPAVAADDYSGFAKVETISCDFRMERHLAIATKPLTSSGHFYFKRPAFLRWEYQQPTKHGFLLDGEKAFSWQTENDKKTVRDISNQPLARLMAEQLRVFISMDMSRIGKHYRISPLDDGVDLIPLNVGDGGQQVDRIRLLFDPKQPAVRQTIIMEKSGEKTVITYANTQLNSPLPTSVSTP